MKFDCQVLRDAGNGWVYAWMCGWYQGEEAWNNDSPSIDAVTPEDAAAVAARLAFAGGRLAESGIARALVWQRDGERSAVAGAYEVVVEAVVRVLTPVEVEPVMGSQR